MLTVIEDNEHVLFTQEFGKHVDDRTLRLFMQTDGNRSDTGHEQEVKNRSKFHKPHTIGISSQNFFPNPYG